MAIPQVPTLTFDHAQLADVKPHGWKRGTISVTFEVPCDTPCPPIPDFMHYREETHNSPCPECKAMLEKLAEWQQYVVSKYMSQHGSFFRLDIYGFSMTGSNYQKFDGFESMGGQFQGWELSAHTPDGELLQVIVPEQYKAVLEKLLTPTHTAKTRLERLLDPPEL